MGWADDIGIVGLLHGATIPVQSSSCSLRVFYRTLAVAKDSYYTSLIKVINQFEDIKMRSADFVITAFVAICRTDFVITASQDGFLKFWKKLEESIEFVKVFRCHLCPVKSLVTNCNGSRWKKMKKCKMARGEKKKKKKKMKNEKMKNVYFQTHRSFYIIFS